MSSKPKLHVVVGGAVHFLRWELPFFEREFEIVPEPSRDAVLLAFGPDVLAASTEFPARRRAALLFPGFGCNPYHNLDYRREALAVIDRAYDLVFVNPGPLAVAYRSCAKVVICPFSVDTAAVEFRSYRTSLDSLIHVSADYPQKDWQRSARVMELTGLPHEVYPSRDPRHPERRRIRAVNRVKNLANRGLRLFGAGDAFHILPDTYVSHQAVIRRYQRYDGFVHIAAEVPNPKHIDGKYTACLMEAGLTGAILFWHDTLGLGNDLETVFSLPADPQQAAAQILEIRKSLDVEQHSRRTREEMLDRFSPERSVGFRCARLKELA